MNLPKNLPSYQPDLKNALRLLNDRGDQVKIKLSWKEILMAE